jgi:thioredoxin 1
LDIKTEWCGPCKALSPIIDELANEYTNVRIGKMDADENKSIIQELGVRSIPTILIFKDGQIVEKHIGSATKAQLKSLIDKHLNQ